jgi:SAM-dependent methyltransferase
MTAADTARPCHSPLFGFRRLSEAQNPSLDSGSFRDREGRIYLYEDRVIRGLSNTALANFRALETTGFYQKYRDAGSIVRTRALPDAENPLPAAVRKLWPGFVEHERVPVISYPYEWTFSMLRDAAALQLELLEAALLEDFTLKDATPYNIQFVNKTPLFIDVPSFEPLPPGVPWVGRRQFCEMYLFPLMLQAYKGVNFQPFLRSAIDGVGVQTANRLFGGWDLLRGGVLTNVWLQARLERRYSATRSDVRGDLKAAGFNKGLILANVRKLRKLVERLQWSGQGSEWGDYASFHNYSDEDHLRKMSFVADSITASCAGTVWDVGCNTGQFSHIAAKHCRQVVATDIDHLAVERLYTDPDMPGNILPLVQNVADPSPNWGWRNLERRDLHYRSRPDLVLCLALLHHVVITANVPLAEFVEWLASLAPGLVIEYVSRSDDKVQTLLRNKEDQYWDYRRDYLLRQLRLYYDIREELLLSEGRRRLYYCARRAGPGAVTIRGSRQDDVRDAGETQGNRRGNQRLR